MKVSGKILRAFRNFGRFYFIRILWAQSHCQASLNHLIKNENKARRLVMNKCSSNFEYEEFCKLHIGKCDFIPEKASKIEY